MNFALIIHIYTVTYLVSASFSENKNSRQPLELQYVWLHAHYTDQQGHIIFVDKFIFKFIYKRSVYWWDDWEAFPNHGHVSFSSDY